jgi:hypothetical protein
MPIFSLVSCSKSNVAQPKTRPSDLSPSLLFTRCAGAELNIGGRTILVDPGVPSSGTTLFGENGFIVGREAFTSDAELTKTLLHETLRPVTNQSAVDVSGEVATSEGTGGKVLIGFLIGAAVVGGVTAIVLSGGTAAPAIIVALEAAGDVAVGTELVDVVIRSTP